MNFKYLMLDQHKSDIFLLLCVCSFLGNFALCTHNIIFMYAWI
jgi:hypothetical protein